MGAVITPSGVQADSQAAVMASLQSAYRDIYGQDIELEPNTPDGQLIGIYAQGISDLTELVKNLFASLFPSTAEGNFLDLNLDLLNMQRIAGKAARVNLSIGLAGAQPIAANAFIVQIQGANFTNDEAIEETGIYSFTASESGAMQFAPDEPIAIATPVAGVSAAFAATLSGGSNYESDFDFRRRWRDLTRTRRNAAPYIENMLRQIEGVEDCNVYERDSDPFDTLPPNCIYAVLKPGYFEHKKVLEAIFSMKPPGIRSYYENAEPSQQATFGRGEIAVGFDFAEFQKIENYQFKFYLKNTMSEVDQSEVQTALKAMKFNIGESVYVSDVNSFVASRIHNCFAAAGNNINGQNFLAGQIRVYYGF